MNPFIFCFVVKLHNIALLREHPQGSLLGRFPYLYVGILPKPVPLVLLPLFVKRSPSLKG
jgi:hypothetical protein